MATTLATEETTVQDTSHAVIIYSRCQLLSLYESPLVKPPIGLPVLKDWFGLENELCLSKKEVEVTGQVQNHPRERRNFRRDAEEREALIRPPIRGTPNQHAQMGHFKHQSIRASDSYRSKDVEKEKTSKEKEKVQERVYPVADQLVRDRTTISPNRLIPSQARSKDGDGTPNSAFGIIPKEGSQHPAYSRRSDTKDTSIKVAADSNEEWRRGVDPSSRSSRDHRHDNHDIPGLNISKQGLPTLKRDTDVTSMLLERRTERRHNVHSVVDGDHSGHGGGRRDVDCDVAPGASEHRRWKDDGKRDERIAARRERQLRERERDHEPRSEDRHARDVSYDPSIDKRHDRLRKHSSGRDKTGGKSIDDENNGRVIYGRERNGEKQPAWMDVSVPSVTEGSGTADIFDEMQSKQFIPHQQPEKALDEIQLFRLMMKQEEEKKYSDNAKVAATTSPAIGNAAETEKSADLHGALSSGVHGYHSDLPHVSQTLGVLPPRTVDVFLDSWKDGSRALSSIISPSASSVISTGTNSIAQAPDTSARVESTVSRFFPNPLSSDSLRSRLPSDQRPEDVRDHDENTGHHYDNSPSESTVFDICISRQPDPKEPPREFHIHQSLSKRGHNMATSLPYDNLRHPPQAPVSNGTNSYEWDLHAEETLGETKGGISSAIASVEQRDTSIRPGLAVAKGSRFAKFFDSKGRPRDRQSPAVGENVLADNWSPPSPEGITSGNLHVTTEENAEKIFLTLTRLAQDYSPNTEFPNDATKNPQHVLNQHTADGRTYVPSRNQNRRLIVEPSRRDEQVANSTHQFLPLSSYDHIYSSPAPPLGAQSGLLCSSNFGYHPGPFISSHSQNTTHGSSQHFSSLAVPGGRSAHPVSESTGFPGVHPGMALGGPRNAQYTNGTYSQPELYVTGSGFGANPQTRTSQSEVQRVQAPLFNSSNASSDVVHGPLQGAHVVFSQQVNQAQLPVYGMRQHQRLAPQIIPHGMPTHLSHQGLAGSSNQSSQDLMALLMGRTSRKET